MKLKELRVCLFTPHFFTFCDDAASQLWLSLFLFGATREKYSLHTDESRNPSNKENVFQSSKLRNTFNEDFCYVVLIFLSVSFCWKFKLPSEWRVHWYLCTVNPSRWKYCCRTLKLLLIKTVSSRHWKTPRELLTYHNKCMTTKVGRHSCTYPLSVSYWASCSSQLTLTDIFCPQTTQTFEMWSAKAFSHFRNISQAKPYTMTPREKNLY